MVDGHAPGPAGPGRPALPIDFESVATLGLLTVPDDGVVPGTTGTTRACLCELEIEGDDATSLGALIRRLDAEGALSEPPAVVRTPTTLMYAATAADDTIALWALDLGWDRWLSETFRMRPPRALGHWYLDLPAGRELVAVEVAYCATPAGRAEWERISAGRRETGGGRSGRVPTDPSQFDY